MLQAFISICYRLTIKNMHKIAYYTLCIKIENIKSSFNIDEVFKRSKTRETGKKWPFSAFLPENICQCFYML